MHEIEIQVRPAAQEDRARILALLDQARRQYVAFGLEDLSSLLAHPTHIFVLADTGPLLWGIACATVRPRPVAPGEEASVNWSYLRGLALTNGWRAEVGVWTLLEGLRVGLQARDATYLVAYATQPWMVHPLLKAGLRPVEHIITYERTHRALPKSVLPPRVHIRPARPDDVSDLTLLDAAAFEPLWRLASGELIGLLVTSGHFVVAERAGRLVGYVCSDVQRGLGHVHRLAVHPDVQGQGIGRALLADALAYCQSAGASLVTINTQQSNARSDRLYRRFGFRPMPRRIPVMMGEIAAREGQIAQDRPP